MNSNVYLGPYQVKAAGFLGGKGTIYPAIDTRHNREVALRIFSSHHWDVKSWVRFAREFKPLTLLEHPNIASIHGVEEHEGKRIMIMEWVEGTTLREVL